MHETSNALEEEHRRMIRTGATHARLRWLGVVFFISALLLLGGTVVAVAMGLSPWIDIFLALFACGLALGTFGSHNDTALAILRDCRGAGDLPGRLGKEMDEEFVYRRLALSELNATPFMAWAITAIALLVQGLVVWRLLG